MEKRTVYDDKKLNDYMKKRRVERYEFVGTIDGYNIYHELPIKGQPKQEGMCLNFTYLPKYRPPMFHIEKGVYLKPMFMKYRNKDMAKYFPMHNEECEDGIARGIEVFNTKEIYERYAN